MRKENIDLKVNGTHLFKRQGVIKTFAIQPSIALSKRYHLA